MPLDPRILEYVERQRAERGIDWFREQLAAEEELPEDPTILGELGKGALAGIDNLQAGAYGVGAMAAQAVGAEGLRDSALEGYERNIAEAQENAPAVGSYEDVGGFRDAALYAAGGLGQLAPSLALSVGTGGVGGLLVRGAALKAGQLAGQRVAQEGGEELLQSQVQKQVANQLLARGATVGAAGSEGATIAGQVYGDRAAEGEYGIAVPLATGVAAGALGGIADSRVINAVLGTSKAGVGRTAATVAGLESATEVGQTALENLAKGDPLTQGMIDAGILGGIGGGIVGGAARAIGGAPTEDPLNARDPLGDALARATEQRNTRADERGLTSVAPDAQFQKPDGAPLDEFGMDGTAAALARARALKDGTEGPISSSTPTREALPSPEMVFGASGATPMPDRSGTIDLSTQLANPVEQAKVRNQGALSTAEALRRASLVEDKQGPISSPPPQAPAAGAITGQPGTVQPDLTATRQTPAQGAASAAADEKAQATYAARQAEEQRRAQAMQAAAPQTMRLRDGSLLVDGNVESVITKFGARYDDTLQATVVPPKQAKKAEAFLAQPATPAAAAPPAQGMQGGGASVTSVIPSSAKLPSIPEARAKREGWQRFKRAETMGVPRAEMPQIKAGDRASLVQFVRARGVSNTQETVDPASLQPTQLEYSPSKVAKAREFVGEDRAILVSSDNRIIDGHHQWLAKREAGVPIRVIRLEKPAAELLPMVREFPSATFEAGSTRNIAAAPAVAESTEPALSRKETADGVQAAPQTAEASGAVPDAVAARPGRTPKVSRRERIATVLAEAAEARGDEAPKRTRVVEPPLKLSGMKLILGQTFGREVVFFDTDDDNAPNGFADPEDPKALYINTRAEKPVQRIVMHELLHSLRTTNEKSYRALKRQVQDMVESDAMTKWRDTYLRKLSRKEGGGYEGDIRDDLVIEEILADAMGDYGTTQEFWQKLSERMEPSLFQRVVQTFAKILQKMMDALGKRSDLGSKRYFSDLQGVQRALLEFADANRLDNTEDADVERDEVMQARRTAPLPVGKAVNEAIDSAADLDAAFRFASSKTFGTNRAFKVELQSRLRALARGMNRDLSEETDANDQYLVRMVERDAKIALRDNANAVGWYDEKVSKARAVLALIHPEIETDSNARFAFTWALAATSNGLKVDKNFELAERAYRRYVAEGKMPTDIGIGTASKAINDAMRVFNAMSAKMPLEKFAELMTTKAPVREIEKLTGYEVSGESPDAEVYGAAIIGPKIGNGFFANLYGHFEQLTMDRWLMRTWGRWTGTLIERNQEQINAKRELLPTLIRKLSAEERAELGRIIGKRIGEKASNADEIAAAITKASQKSVNRDRMADIATLSDLSALDDLLGKAKKGQARESIGDEIRKAGNALTKYIDGQKESPKGAVERRRIRRVFNRSLASLQKQYPGLTMSDLQALLWYPEKRLYDAAGAIAEDDDAEAGYADDEAPDYANSAVKLAGLAGVEKSKIDAAIKEVDRARNQLERGPGAAQRAGGVSRADAEARATAGAQLSRRAVGGGAGGRPSPDGQVPASERAVPQAERSAEEQAGQLKPLPGYAHRKVEGAGPIPEIVAAAEQYARQAGIPIKRQARYATVDETRGKRISDAYAEMQHTPNDPAVREAYRELIRQTTAQYQALVDAGYQFWFIDTKQESNKQYASSPWNAIRELRSSKRMGVFPTNDGFGTGTFDPAANPLLEETAFEWPIGGPDGPMQPVLANDLFRAVHDAFGHGLEGAGFRAQGEENAWQAHVRLFHGPAVAAITTETRGQNSWLNFNDGLLRDSYLGEERAKELHPKDWETITVGEHNRTAKTDDTIFADQKTGLLPAWAWMEGREFDSLNEITDAKKFAAAVKRVKEGRPFAFPLHLHDEQTYADARLFLSDDGESGFALMGDEIASLFSAGNGAVTSVLAQAVQEGGRRIEAYRTRMPKALASGGFMPVARVAFDREMADPAWDAAKFRQFQNGEPDLVMFAYMPDETVDVADVPLVSYEEAAELQRQAVAKRPVMQSRRAKPDAQAAAVRAKYEGTPQWLKAPNGKPSKLSENEWVQVRTPNFKKWFGDWEKYAGMPGGVWNDGEKSVSKVVDENGEPRVVFHGSKTAGFNHFDPETNRKGDFGTFFSSSRDTAMTYSGTRSEAEITQVTDDFDEDFQSGRGIYPVFLNLRNPHEESFDGANWDGSRMGQYTVLNEDGETVYDDSGQGYFDNERDAQKLADQHEGSEVHSADDHYATTDSVVREARQYGNDGAIIRQVVDDGPEGYGAGDSDIYVIFDSTQVKSATQNTGAFSPKKKDIRFSRRQQQTPEFKAWSKGAPVFEPEQLVSTYNGGPLVAMTYHATTADVEAFDMRKANVESDLGRAIYTTNKISDANTNYGNEKGPDLEAKIMRDADRMTNSEVDADGEEMDYATAKAAAKDRYVQNQGNVMPVYVALQNPAVLGGVGQTRLDFDENYDEEADEYGEPTGTLVDFANAIRDAMNDRDQFVVDGDADTLYERIMEHGRDYGFANLSDAIELVKGSGELDYTQDTEDGLMARGEVIRQALKEMGYDGIVDRTVNEKFGDGNRNGMGMEDMGADTVHVLAFKPTQVKSAIGNRGTFSSEDRRVTYSRKQVDAGRSFFTDEALKEFDRLGDWKDRSARLYLQPADFLALADDDAGNAKPEAEQAMARGERLRELPLLIIDKQGRVRGHEGRNRMRAIMARDPDAAVPVNLRSDVIRWANQGVDSYDRVEFPATLRAQAKAADPDFTMPFPIAQGEVEGVGKRNVMFSRRSQPLYAGQPDMELGAENLREKMTRLLVNNMNRVQKAKEYLAARGATFDDSNDVETSETLYYGKSGEMLRQLDQKRIKPLMELVKRAENMGLDVAKVDEYLIAKHAEERNKAVAAINKNFPDGGSGMKTADARAILASYSGPRLAALEAVSNAVQDMHRERVKMLRDFGLTDPDELDAWARKYKHYVPLKTVDEEPDGMGTGMGYDIRGKESKRALGRGDRATSPLLVSILDAQRTIIRAQKAEVGRTILRFAEQDKAEDLFEIKTQDQFRTTVFNSSTGKTQDALDTAAMRDAFAVKQGGKLKFIVVKDEVLKDQLQKIGASQVGPVLGLIGKGTRALSKLYTQYNPSFTLVNAVRDAITAGVNAKAYDRISSGRLIRELPKAWKAIAAVNFGKGNAQWKQTYEEFLEDGASSAGFGLDTIKDLRTKAEREFKLAVGQNGLGRSKKAWHATVRGFDRMGTIVSNANEVFENAARLSLYAQAREQGYTRQQAARMAKEVTVNFNRKGEWGSQINSAFMFFNAAVQGNRALYTHMQKSRKVKAAVFGIGAMGFVLAMLNDGMDEDEETGDEVENKISDWELDHSAVLFTDSDGTRVKFPLPYGYNVAYVLGRRAYRFLTGKDGAQKTAIGMVAAAYDSFMPLGGSADDSTIAQAGVRMMLPTIGTPFFDLAVNRDSFGKPIAKEIVSRYDANVPNSQRYFGGVSPWAKGLTEWLNSASGGNAAKAGAIDINPEHLDFWLKFATGGVGSTATGVAQLAGDDPSLDRTPIVKAFYGNEPDYYVSSRFREVREISDVLEGRMRDRDETLTPEELRVARASKAVNLSLNRLYKRLKATRAAGQDATAVEERIEQQQRRLIKAFNSTELGEAA